MRISWRDQAEADIDELFEYLLERNTSAAHRLLAAIRDQVGQLGDQPGLGRPGRVAGTRELVISRTPYVVAYTVDHHNDTVIVLRVLHGARRWPDAL
jgi:toxin ParE1/3/4